MKGEENMTGRELIIYILENGLEDEQVFSNGRFVGFLSVGEAAQKLGYGIETVRAMVELGLIENVHDSDMIPEKSIRKLIEKE